MTSDSQEHWRIDARFLLRGGLTVFGVGMVIALVAQMGAGGPHPLSLLLSGLASVAVFLVVCGLLRLLSRGIQHLEGLRRAAAEAALSRGDRLLLFTDGLPEAPVPGDEPLGYQALADLLPPAGLDPGPWLDELFARIRRATGPEVEDDWTALLLERRP